MESDAVETISVIIPSVGRANLTRTITDVRVAARHAALSYDIIVVDDSVSGAATAICAAAEDGSGDLKVVQTRSRNIATARNAGLGAATGDWLAFIDDDEWPEPTWLTRNLAMARRCGAAAVIGPVRAHYPAEAPRWIVAGDPYSRWWLTPATNLRQGSTANALVRRAALVEHGLFFDNRFGRTGGEDSDLFNRLSRSGGKIVSGDGVVHEEVGAARCTMRDLAKRAIRVGQTYAATRSPEVSGGRRVMAVTVTSAKILLYVSGAGALMLFKPRHAMAMWLNGWRNAGKIALIARRPLIDYYANAESAHLAAAVKVSHPGAAPMRSDG